MTESNKPGDEKAVPPNETGPIDVVPEHVAVYLRMRAIFGDPGKRSPDARKRAKKSKEAKSVPYGAGRDPRGIDDILTGLTARLGWTSSLAKADLLASWSELAGEETALHSEPISIEDGVLLVRCDSTAWATQLRLMRRQITTNIATRFPDAAIESVRFDGPNAPSWKRGPRSIPGRGPRDTYG
jgi:predicted nucleic acid-binding Zn ribbon protein